MPRYETPDDLFADLPPGPEQLTALVVRELIFETLPEAREKLSWGAPFYFHRISFAFLWPASIPWGSMEEGVGLGFTHGDRFDHGGRLQPYGKGRLARIIFTRPEEIDVDWVQEVLVKAWNTAG